MRTTQKSRENRYVCCGNLDIRTVTAISSFVMFAAWGCLVAWDAYYSLQLTNFSNIRVIHPSVFEVVTSLGFSTFILLTPLLLFIGNRLRIALFYVPAVHIARPVVFSTIVYLAVLILTMLPEVGKTPDLQHVKSVLYLNLYLWILSLVLFFLNIAARDYVLVQREAKGRKNS